ncbi:MAG: bifunctional methylenetetrahydrofolate dehydrogenase/methenyltetrahydrofolate cyclohydrolase, partial [Anaerolineae bacterium]|nr:bifunctional methylenetetrahydrofolate dehydrogenase/methenyltetrahydrofolate cyclohydrolase [Anaerolineae bacterium]
MTHTAQIIDGKAIAADIRAEIAKKVTSRLEKGLSRPGLATVLVGEDPASEVYVRMKRKACAELGIESFGHELPADISQEALEKVVAD